MRGDLDGRAGGSRLVCLVPVFSVARVLSCGLLHPSYALYSSSNSSHSRTVTSNPSPPFLLLSDFDDGCRNGGGENNDAVFDGINANSFDGGNTRVIYEGIPFARVPVMALHTPR